jgi:phosphatidylglycerol:prolipoprotein diacylglycerol transferase
VILLFSNFQYYSQNLREIFSLSTLRSPGVYYGSLLLAIAAAALVIVKKRLPALTMADVAAPGIALGQAIARLGCLSAGCCYGKPTQMPWGIVFVVLTKRLSKKHAGGQIMLEFLALYSCLRFVVEFFRGDDRGFVLYGLLSTSQFIAILTVLGSAVLYYFVVRRTRAASQN